MPFVTAPRAVGVEAVSVRHRRQPGPGGHRTYLGLHAQAPEPMTEPMTEIVGWASSVILLLTLGKQVHKQWREHASEGVSRWLFIGQIGASVGFTVYSWMVRNWVFVVTNGLLVLNALLGFAITHRNRRRTASNCRTMRG
jgi:uncharacterized protein with PQ loop repeat